MGTAQRVGYTIEDVGIGTLMGRDFTAPFEISHSFCTWGICFELYIEIVFLRSTLKDDAALRSLKRSSPTRVADGTGALKIAGKILKVKRSQPNKRSLVL
jgi:hypothetical protein